MMKWTQRWILALVISIVVVATAAATPFYMPYQGKLTDASGNAINSTQTVTFTIYDLATAGTVLYSETQSITPVGGNFTALIGTGSLVSGSWTPDIFSGSAIYLAIQVGADPEMTPRIALGSVPFAMRSYIESGLSASRGGGSITVTSTSSGAGNDIISTTIATPAAGYIVVTINSQLDIFGSGTGFVWGWISETSGGGIPGVDYTVDGPATISGGTYQAFSFMRVFQKPAGTYTFYFTSAKGGASASVTYWYPRMTAIYIPDALGAIGLAPADARVARPTGRDGDPNK